MGVSKTTVHHWIVASTIHVHSNSLKPILTEEIKWARVEWPCTSGILMISQSTKTCMTISIWMRSGSFSPEEKNPTHHVKHKSHITKVMFLCAVVRLCYNPCSKTWWDGKLGIWPIGDWEPAQQGSKNRLKGTLVWKNKLVTKSVYQDLLVSKLLPAIMEKWLRRDRLSRKIFIQQDRAKSHISEDDKEFNDALTENDINVVLYMQPTNSPDVNLLDLGFLEASRVSTT